MLPGSHVAPINTIGPDAHPSTRMLADAFSEFISASSLLEASYRDLQQEVAHLGVELAERNAALSRSVAENDRMRAALQQMIDSMPCGVLVLDTAEIIVTINPEGRRLLELGETQLRSLRELSAISQVNFESLMRTSEPNLDNEVCVSSPTGRRWLAIGHRMLSNAPASHTTNVRTGLKSIWILRDITATKQAEQEREAARSAMALAEVSSILAHEIRNPLASMELFAGLIAEDSGQTQEWVSHLRAGIRSLSGTVNNVLSIHSGIKPHLAAIDLTECVHGGVEFVRPIAEQAGVSLIFSGSQNALRILGNEDCLRQIILNLICNAIRHTPAGGEITVSTHGTALHVIVSITDSGCGIPDGVIGRVFDAGFTADGNTPGLGLAVCKRLMNQHGGEIRVSSRVNQGSTFLLEFPTL